MAEETELKEGELVELGEPVKTADPYFFSRGSGDELVLFIGLIVLGLILDALLIFAMAEKPMITPMVVSGIFGYIRGKASNGVEE